MESLSKLGEWDDRNFTKFNKVKCRVLHMVQN